MGKPLFSIICTLRKKYECFYGQLIDGIKNQTFTDFECLLLNDEKEHDWIVLPDERFKPIFLEQEYGLAVKRNIGISKAIGKYVIFCDADDFFPKNLLKTFKDISDRYDADFIVPKTTRDEKLFETNEHTIDDKNLIKDKDEIYDVFFGRYSSDEYTLKGFMFDGCWGRAFKNEVLKKYAVKFLEEPCRAEDALFNNDYVKHVESLYLLPDYYGYCWRDNSTSETFNINSFFYNINPFLDRLYEQLKSCDEKYSANLDKYSAGVMFSQIYKFCSEYKNQKAKVSEIVPILKNMFRKDSKCYELIRNKKVLTSRSRKLMSFLIRAKAYRSLVRIVALGVKKITG